MMIRSISLLVLSFFTCGVLLFSTPQVVLAEDMDEGSLELMEEGEGEEDEDEERFQQRLRNAASNLGLSNHNQVEQSIFFFEKMGDEAIPHLEKVLVDSEENKRRRNNVLYTFGRLGENARLGVTTLAKYLRHEDAETRAVAAISLGKIGDGARNMVPSLMVLLRDNDNWVRESAYTALERIGGKQAEKAIALYKKKTEMK